MSGGNAAGQGGAAGRGEAGREPTRHDSDASEEARREPVGREPERRGQGREHARRNSDTRDTERRHPERRDPEPQNPKRPDPDERATDERATDERNGRQQFIDALGDVLASWNLPRSTGRVYGALLLRAEPVTFDDLRAELQLSAGAVSTGVRELVSWGLARTIPQAGSRRLFVEAAGGFEQLLAASHERTRAFIRVLDAGAALIDGPRAGERLADVTALFEGYVDAGERMLRARARTAKGSR
jgi:hypothetical protein